MTKTLFVFYVCTPVSPLRENKLNIFKTDEEENKKKTSKNVSCEEHCADVTLTSDIQQGEQNVSDV